MRPIQARVILKELSGMRNRVFLSCKITQLEIAQGSTISTPTPSLPGDDHVFDEPKVINEYRETFLQTTTKGCTGS